jgi:hypothetical protein
MQGRAGIRRIGQSARTAQGLGPRDDEQVMNRGRPGLGVNQSVIPLPTVAGILAVTAIAVFGVIAVVGVAVRHRAKTTATAAPASAQAGLLTASDLGAGWRAWDKAIPRTTATTSLPDATQNSLTDGVNQCLNGNGFAGGSASRANGHFVRDAGPRADLFASVDEWSSPAQAEAAFGAYSVDALNSCFANAGEQAASQHIKEWGWPSLRGGQTYIQVLPKPNVGMHAVAGRSVITMQFLIDTTAHVYVDVIGIQEGRYTTSLTVVSSFLPLTDDAEYAVEKAADSRLQSLSA